MDTHTLFFRLINKMTTMLMAEHTEGLEKTYNVLFTDLDLNWRFNLRNSVLETVLIPSREIEGWKEEVSEAKEGGAEKKTNKNLFENGKLLILFIKGS